MNRIEENKEMLEQIEQLNCAVPEGSFEQLAILHLHCIERTLGDISKSLVLIAERSEKNG